jgi:tRNA(fMet)-specific endonuclease VapC
MAYLLDTNIISDLVRNPNGKVAERIEAVGETEVCTSIIVAAELRFRALKKASRNLTIAVEGLLQRMRVLPFQEPADLIYARLRNDLERAGTLVGSRDMLIAAHAIASENKLVTANEREFARVKHLKWINWLKK